ncbi:3-deoxy-D-manno-octulosonic acid transferase [Roseovarius arcticus]|uniref:3-deoxy-D-manno-octulosonic acid transferase n=1 Tax=Roseovarius arcticus TaxID=2547404 RepID=UPI0011105FAA|nr:3-deoxy-D-manno-octulosonic acid transferase [Roseovarius arcticus]
MPASLGPPTLLLRVYALASRAIAPLAMRRVQRKLTAHGTSKARIAERMGHASMPRPAGDLLWFHAASVGESLSILRLIAHLGETHPALNFLITSGTATSASILAQRMPPRCLHQFAPLDAPAAVTRFLDHWQPSAGVFVESELWPNILRVAARRGIPLALLNARISDRSARGWARIGGTARHLLGHFAMVHCQDARTADHLRRLGCDCAAEGANLKAMAGPVPYDAAAVAQLNAQIGGRPVWAMASTHPGEEDVAITAHVSLLEAQPEALLILIPRHPERAEGIAAMLDKANLRHARRSTGGEVDPSTQVYLADTLGEMGLWYALAPIVCVGGSFVPVGGHNPYEVAHGGAAVLHGPLYANFAAAYAQIDASGAARQVEDAAALADALLELNAAPDMLAIMQSRASQFAAAQDDQLEDLASTLCAALRLG